MSNNNVAQIPTSFGHELRACLRCRLVKTYDQFRESGCENCPFLNMDKDHEIVGDCTTSNFTGIISVMDPSKSWAARWLRIGRFAPGVYTLAVAEELPEEFQAICEENRVQYMPPKRVNMRGAYLSYKAYPFSDIVMISSTGNLMCSSSTVVALVIAVSCETPSMEFLFMKVYHKCKQAKLLTVLLDTQSNGFIYIYGLCFLSTLAQCLFDSL